MLYSTDFEAHLSGLRRALAILSDRMLRMAQGLLIEKRVLVFRLRHLVSFAAPD